MDRGRSSTGAPVIVLIKWHGFLTRVSGVPRVGAGSDVGKPTCRIGHFLSANSEGSPQRTLVFPHLTPLR